MRRRYHFTGTFEVETDCPDVDRIARVLNETAKQFGDILEFNSEQEKINPAFRGYMWIHNDMDITIPINETADDEEESEIEAE